MLRHIRRFASNSGVLQRHSELRRRPDILAQLQRSERCLAMLFDQSLSPLVVPAGSQARASPSKSPAIEPLLVSWPHLVSALNPELDRPVVYLGGDAGAEGRHYFAVAASPRLLAWATEEASPMSGGTVSTPTRLHLMAATRKAHLWAPARSLLAWHLYNRYCSACGGPTESADAGHRLLCRNPDCLVNRAGSSADHPISHPRLDPTAIVLVTSSSSPSCLLARKAAFPGGMLSCLAGFAEAGESLEDCAIREVHEEVGVAVPRDRLAYDGSQAWPFPAQLMIGFRASVDGTPDIKLDADELEFAGWFGASQVSDMLLARNSQWRVPPRAALANRLISNWLKSL